MDASPHPLLLLLIGAAVGFLARFLLERASFEVDDEGDTGRAKPANGGGPGDPQLPPNKPR